MHFVLDLNSYEKQLGRWHPTSLSKSYIGTDSVPRKACGQDSIGGTRLLERYNLPSFCGICHGDETPKKFIVLLLE